MKRIKIANKFGIHARPASQIVAAAMKHDGKVYLIKSWKKGDAKSVLNILGMGIVAGDTIKIVAEGNDSDKIESEIEQIILNSEK
jgi:phosphocarrier protein HPr